ANASLSGKTHRIEPDPHRQAPQRDEKNAEASRRADEGDHQLPGSLVDAGRSGLGVHGGQYAPSGGRVSPAVHRAVSSEPLSTVSGTMSGKSKKRPRPAD